MSTNCLVTKMKGQVNNSDLEKLGVLVIKNKVVEAFSEGTSRITISHAAPITIKVVEGDGVLASSFSKIASSTLKEIVLSGNSSFYCSNHNFTMEISNKYDIQTFDATSHLVIEDIKKFNCIPLTRINITNQDAYGDISVFSNIKNARLEINQNRDIYGDITGFTNSITERTKVYGDFTALFENSTMSSANYLRDNVSPNIKTCDFSKSSSTIKFISNNTSSKVIGYWKTTRPSTSQIIAFEGGRESSGLGEINFGDDLDAMLINQADCQTYEATGVYKRINVHGNRTSASDTAVASLKEKGFDIRVNGVIL